MITAPICEFVRRYRYNGALRMHMPGHKGTALLGPEPLDLTEIEGADVLYHAEGIIRESEANAAALFGTKKTVYSAEGSSLCIRDAGLWHGARVRRGWWTTPGSPVCTAAAGVLNWRAYPTRGSRLSWQNRGGRWETGGRTMCAPTQAMGEDCTP